MSEVFDRRGGFGHEQVTFVQDPGTGLRAIVAVHSTVLGPALGGTRFYPYTSEGAAVQDVLRLSRAMTHKASVAGLDLGGGKAVILGDPAIHGSEPLLRAYGRALERLGGTYITAEDVGTTVEDMVVIRQETAHVAGLPPEQGGSGDPSPATARGVEAAMRAVASRIWDTRSVAGRRIAVLGVGKVGAALVDRLVVEGAEVVVADVSRVAVDAVTSRHAVEVVGVEQMLEISCDILAPCALGGVLDAASIPLLRCSAVVGAANNQLAQLNDAERLRERGITYAPDFVANAGGLINIAEEIRGYDAARAEVAVEAVEARMTLVLEDAERRGINTVQAAVDLAEARIAAAQRAEVAA